MKKILIIHSSGANSGGEEISRQIYRNLNKDFEFSFFIPCIKEQNKFLEAEDKQFYSETTDILSIIKSLKKTITNIKPDIIHAHGTRAAFLIKLYLLFKRKKFKFFYTIHGFHIAHKKGLLNQIIIKLEIITNLLFVDKIICVGESDYKLVKNYSFKKGSVILIKNGVIKPINKKDLEIEAICKQNRYNILSIGRLHYQKDFNTLIKSMEFLADDIGLTIIGDGPQKKELQLLAQSNKKITFLTRNKASSLIHYFNIFVLSTNWEGLPLVILESMLNNTPVIGSNVHGVSELINNNETGLLFNPGDPKDLAVKIKQIKDNEYSSHNIITNAYNFVTNHYSINGMIDKYKNLYLYNL